MDDLLLCRDDDEHLGEEAADEAANMDLVLLGPHVRFVKPEIEKGANGTPIYVMAPQDFGTMNTKAIVDAALKLVSAA